MSFNLELPEDYYATGIANARQQAADSATASISATGTTAGDIAIWTGAVFEAGALISGSGISASIVYAPALGLQFGVTASTLRTTLSISAQAIAKSNLSAAVAPGINDDNTQGYGTGSIWVDTTGGDAYIAITVGTGAASWKKISP